MLDDKIIEEYTDEISEVPEILESVIDDTIVNENELEAEPNNE